MRHTGVLTAWLILVLAGTVAVGSSTVAAAGDHPRTTTAASSCVLGCENPSWSHRNLIDSNNGSAWSSTYHATADGYEWFAFWFDGFRGTDYLRLVPRTYLGANYCVPESVTIYYSANGQWNYTGVSVNLSADMAQDGYTIPFPRVSTNGLLVVTNRLRPDPYGGYYFQLAEAFAGITGPTPLPPRRHLDPLAPRVDNVTINLGTPISPVMYRASGFVGTLPPAKASPDDMFIPLKPQLWRSNAYDIWSDPSNVARLNTLGARIQDIPSSTYVWLHGDQFPMSDSDFAEWNTRLTAEVQAAPQIALEWDLLNEPDLFYFSKQPPAMTELYRAWREAYQIVRPKAWSGSVKASPATASASASFGEAYLPTLAIDGNLSTCWNSGGFAPQWIDIDLCIPQYLVSLRLLPNQYPVTGNATHQIQVASVASPTSTDYTTVATLRQSFTSGQWVEVRLGSPCPNVRHIRIYTTASGSWVSWLEIEAYVATFQTPRPNDKIVGPSFGHYDATQLAAFLVYARDNGVLPDRLSWHENSEDDSASKVERHVSEMESWMQSNLCRILPIDINEYTPGGRDDSPGTVVHFMAKMERARVGGAHACWGDTPYQHCADRSFNGLLAPDCPQGRSTWWVYRHYADMAGPDMSGQILSSSWSGTGQVDAVASWDGSTLQILFGWDTVGPATAPGQPASITLTGLNPAWRTAQISLRYLSASPLCPAPNVYQTSTVDLPNGPLVIYLPPSQAWDAYYYRITFSP